VPQHDHKPRPELGGGELDAPDLRGGDDVAGDADDKQVAQALVKNDLGRHPRVRTAEDDGEGRLAGRQGVAAGMAGQRIQASDVGCEAAIPLAQAFKRVLS